MNIAVDVMPLVNGSYAKRGVGFLTKQMLLHMFQNDKTNRYFLFNIYSDRRNPEIDLMDMFGHPANVSEQYFCMGKDFWTLRNHDYDVIMGKVIRRFIRENKIDVFIHFSPTQNKILYNYAWYEDTYLITYCYDLIPYVFPETYRTAPASNEKLDCNLSFMTHSEKVIAISECSKNDLCRITGYEKENVEVVYPAASDFWEITSENTEVGLLDDLGINGEYILTVTGYEWRKNNNALIEAFAKVSDGVKNKCQLVIVGFFGFYQEEYLQNLIASFSLTDRVILTGQVSDDVLRALYAGAKAFVFVSKYEGFGLPIIEAMRMGCPVLTANNSSCAEVAGDAAILCDPFDVNDIAVKLNNILSNADLVDMKGKSLEQAKHFSYDSAAQNLISIINSITPKGIDTTIKIAYFSSVPAIVSGISDFCVDSVNDILNDYSVDVFVDDGYEIDIALFPNARILNHKEFPVLASRYDRYLFQMGANKYHFYEYPYIEKFGGIIELHDLDYYDTLKQYAIVPHSADFSKYKTMLLDDMTSEAADERISCIYAGTQQNRTGAVNKFITKYADEIIVHSRYAKDLLSSKDTRSTEIMSYKSIINNMTYKEARRILEFEEDEIVIVNTGLVNSAKRILPVLSALSNILANTNKKIKFYLVGKLYEPSLREPINAYSNRFINIRHIENVSTEMMNIYTIAADIAVCCRHTLFNPDFMQPSATALSAARYGKCIITSRTGWFDEFPDDICVKIDSPVNISQEEEVVQLIEAFNNLIENKKVREEYSAKMKLYADEMFSPYVIKPLYSNLISNTAASLYSKQQIEYLKNDFISYVPNKELLSEFEQTITYSLGE